jgi:hypothetical protein
MLTHDKPIKRMKNHLSMLMVVITILVANQSLVAQQKKKVAPRTTTTTKSNYNNNNSSVQSTPVQASQPVQQKTTYQEPVVSSTSSQKATSYSSNEKTANVSDDPTQVLKISPFGFLIGYYSLDYERAISDKTSVSIGGGYWRGFGEDPIGLYSVNLGSSYYLSKDRYAPRGLYFGPRASAVFSADSNVKGFYYSAGAMFGYQSVASSSFVFDIGIGANYVNFKDIKIIDGTSSGAVLPSFQLAIGYGF